jgi:hypothetical protein
VGLAVPVHCRAAGGRAPSGHRRIGVMTAASADRWTATTPTTYSADTYSADTYSADTYSADTYSADTYSEVTTDRRMSVAMKTTVNARSNCTPPRFTGLSTRRTGAITGSVSR